MPKIGPYSRPHALAKLDGRTREARLMQNVREELTQHIGGQPSATEQALIERAVWLSLHIALFDAKLTESGDGGIPSDRDSRQYLAWSNSLTRILKQLGADKPKRRQKRSQADIFGERGVAA